MELLRDRLRGTWQRLSEHGWNGRGLGRLVKPEQRHEQHVMGADRPQHRSPIHAGLVRQAELRLRALRASNMGCNRRRTLHAMGLLNRQLDYLQPRGPLQALRGLIRYQHT